LPAAGPWSRVFRGPAGIGEHICHVECGVDAAGYDLAVAGAGRWQIAADGSAVRMAFVEPGADPCIVRDTLLGPGLVLALALQGVWCLHASALLHDGAAVAFLGPSGAGKSTLAARLPSVNGYGWQTLADDLLPVECGTDGPVALPHFPQLKLAPDCQPAAGRPERTPLRALYLLDTRAGGPAGVTAERLGARAAVLALAGQTMAGRLFDRRLLGEHLRFCTGVATQIPVRRLSYRRDYDLLPQIACTIGRDLAGDAHPEQP
jgi:hypothetical protein